MPTEDFSRRMETKLAQLGNRQDPQTGAVTLPIYYSTTFSHPAAGKSTGYDYSRMANPTRAVLESSIAALEGGSRGFAFASGMAAVNCVLMLFSQGDHLIVSDDLYGGTYRLFEQVLAPLGITCSYVNMACLESVANAFLPNTKALFVETPTNPLMKITDIKACAALAKERGIITIVDNTFMTPFYQRPLELGADIVVHSATKFLGGHNDVLAGLVVASDESLCERIGFLQNATGAVLGPQDCFLLIRGMKTLALRMARSNDSALAIAKWLAEQPMVRRVYYPGLQGHVGGDVHCRQATGGGGMVSFEVTDARMVPRILDGVNLITFAESLGGVESLITYPATQTHADIPLEVRERVGVTDRLLRLSVGIEHLDDLVLDLDQALNAALRDTP